MYEIEDQEVYDDKAQRHREMMSLLFDAFYQDGMGSWLISPKSIANIFYGENSKQNEVVKIINLERKQNTNSESKGIDIEFLSSIIKKITDNNDDIKSFNYYKKIHFYS